METKKYDYAYVTMLLSRSSSMMPGVKVMGYVL